MKTIHEIPIQQQDQAVSVLALQHASYRIEAELIGFADLPPLQENAEDLRNCGETFYGYWEEGKLVGAISFNDEDTHYQICRMMVHPEHFRKGIAGKLLRYVLGEHPGKKGVVTTGARNIPAIRLYEAHGFKLVKQVKVAPNLSLAWLEREVE